MPSMVQTGRSIEINRDTWRCTSLSQTAGVILIHTAPTGCVSVRARALGSRFADPPPRLLSVPSLAICLVGLRSGLMSANYGLVVEYMDRAQGATQGFSPQNLHGTHTSSAKSSGRRYVAAALLGDGHAAWHLATSTEAVDRGLVMRSSACASHN